MKMHFLAGKAFKPATIMDRASHCLPPRYPPPPPPSPTSPPYPPAAHPVANGVCDIFMQRLATSVNELQPLEDAGLHTKSQMEMESESESELDSESVSVSDCSTLLGCLVGRRPNCFHAAQSHFRFRHWARHKAPNVATVVPWWGSTHLPPTADWASLAYGRVSGTRVPRPQTQHSQNRSQYKSSPRRSWRWSWSRHRHRDRPRHRHRHSQWPQNAFRFCISFSGVSKVTKI